ncbi:CU044_2847 family protein [Saccharopolyspora sp. 5N708]|uniref:CU044_2847 family protein n=1 Tax=Saccharopolyspora sp. 5N708 TaxID=3457424 RepID=UPI003FD2497C
MKQTMNLDGSGAEIVAVRLADGRTVQVEVDARGGEEEVAGRAFSMPAMLDDVRELCRAVGNAVGPTVVSKTTVTFGVTFSMESGKIFAVLAKSGVQANMSISMELTAPNDGEETS